MSICYLSVHNPAGPAECPAKGPVTTKLYGKNGSPDTKLMGGVVEEYDKGHSYYMGCLVSMALTDGLKGPFKVMP